MENEGIILELLSFSIDTWNEKSKEIVSVVTLLPSEFRDGQIYEKITSLNDSMEAVAYSLFVLFFLAGIVKTFVSFDELKRFETAIKILLRFAVGKILISMSSEILLAIMKIASGIGNAVAGNIDGKNFSYTEIPYELSQKIEDLTFLQSIPIFAIALIFTAVILVLSYRMLLIVYGRFFRIYLYMTLAPVAFSSFASNFSSHIGRNFIKSFISVSLESMIIIFSLVIFSYFASSAPVIAKDAGTLKYIFSYLGQLMFNLLILNTLVSCSDRVVKEMIM